MDGGGDRWGICMMGMNGVGGHEHGISGMGGGRLVRNG